MDSGRVVCVGSSRLGEVILFSDSWNGRVVPCGTLLGVGLKSSSSDVFFGPEVIGFWNVPRGTFQELHALRSLRAVKISTLSTITDIWYHFQF
jgi:hypothetical protein